MISTRLIAEWLPNVFNLLGSRSKSTGGKFLSLSLSLEKTENLSRISSFTKKLHALFGIAKRKANRLKGGLQHLDLFVNWMIIQFESAGIRQSSRPDMNFSRKKRSIQAERSLPAGNVGLDVCSAIDQRVEWSGA